MENYFFDPEDASSSLNPPPDVYDLFAFYNKTFFDNVLEACEIKWSKRMTLCAGQCQLSSTNSCTITLSQSLLQFRSNNEIKETLLHEMIHAYLFLTKPAACRENGGHGNEFQFLMNFIKEITNLSITIYHSFHDEVDMLRTHIWKCDGKCVEKAPYFGIVKRAMNRVPGPNDSWWKKHQEECGGTYTKIDGPEFRDNGVKKKDEKKKKPKKDRKITEYLIKNKNNSIFLDASSTLSTQCEKDKEESHQQVYRFKFASYQEDKEREILQFVLSNQIKFKEMSEIISCFFFEFSRKDLVFLHSDYAQVEPEASLLELIMIQGVMEFSFLYMEVIEFSLSLEFIYDISPNLNPMVFEATKNPKVFCVNQDDWIDGFLMIDTKENINEKLLCLVKNNIFEGSAISII